MDRQKRNLFTSVFMILVLVAVALMLTRNLRRTTHIVLPAPGTEENSVQPGSAIGEEGLTLVEITPDTVQAAVATLQRPTAYRRDVEVEQFWSGGQGKIELATCVFDSWTRIDRTLPDGQLRHTLTDGEITYIWYNEEEQLFEGATGGISADEEQLIPTYEDILSYAPEELAAAGYEERGSENCIYVETAPDENGYVLRYWVSVETGLLTAAEKDWNGSCIYRMTASPPKEDETNSEPFTLPDGRILASRKELT